MYKNILLIIAGLIGTLISVALFAANNYLSFVAILLASLFIFPFKQTEKIGTKEKSITVAFLVVIAIVFLKPPKPIEDKQTITKHERAITKKELKDKWPLTVDNAVIACVNDSVGKAPIVIIHGEPYGLTGWADAQYGQKNIKAFNKYWAKNPKIKGLYKDTDPLKNAALKLCN